MKTNHLKIISQILLLVLFTFTSCGKDDPVTTSQTLSDEALLISLSVTVGDQVQNATINGNTVALSNPIPDNVDEITVNSIQVSDLATTNFQVGQTLAVADSPFTITVTSENEEKANSYTLNLSTVVIPPPTGDTGMHMGIIGFHGELSRSKGFYNIIEEDRQFLAKDFIDNLTEGNGTGLYFSMQEGINNLVTNAESFPDDLSKVYIVTFTDGLDNVSGHLAGTGDSQGVKEDVINKIASSMVKDIPILSYTVGVKGNDLVGNDLQDLKEDLRELSSGDEYYVFANNYNELNAKFEEIASSLTTLTNARTDLACVLPAADNGTVVRWTFDTNENGDAGNSNYYIQGVINRDNGNFILENMVYSGMNMDNYLSTVQGTVSGASVQVNFEGFNLCQSTVWSNPNSDNIVFWKQRSDGTWQKDSESGSGQVNTIQVETESIGLMLVLDNSSSLGSNFSTVKGIAKDFIDTLVYGYKNPNPVVDYECEESAFVPTTPTLYGPTESYSSNSLRPQFSWSSSTDLDGNTVSYNLYLGTDQNNLQPIMSNLDNTNLYLSNLLNANTTYYWQVEAHDGTVGSKSEIQTFVTGTGVYDGDLYLSSQAAIESIEYKEVTGALYIQSSSITNLEGLSVLNKVKSILIQHTSIENLNGLQNLLVEEYVRINSNYKLTSLSGFNSNLESLQNLEISYNNSLKSLEGVNYFTSLIDLIVGGNDALTSIDFPNLTSLEGFLSIGYNNSLTSIAFPNLTNVNGLSFQNNYVLSNLQGLNNLTTIGDRLIIENNYVLESLSGLNNLTSILGTSTRDISIQNNDKLTNLDALSNLTDLGTEGKILIQSNDELTNFCGIRQLVTNGEVSDSSNSYYYVYSNAYNPNYTQIQNEGSGGCQQ